MREYYYIKIEFEGNRSYTLWYSDDEDGVLTEKSKITSFSTLSELKEYTIVNKLYTPNDSVTEYDFDIINKWAEKPSELIDSKMCIDYWNIFTDISKSIGIPFIGNFDTGITIDIYNKLFYGSNVSAIRCDGEMYQPEWSEEELNQLAKIMKNGICLLSNSLKP